MLLSKEVEMRWNPRNIKRYTDLGYKYTKAGDAFMVNVNDLPRYSVVLVDVKCDYCGAIYKTKWMVYAGGRLSAAKKDCCSSPKCTGEKAAEAFEAMHGVKYCAQIPEVVERRKATCVERYGTENPFASEEIKEKIKNVNIEKYGVPYTQQNKEVRAKTERTCMERYGVNNYVELFAGKFIGENSPNWKGGPAYSRVERATYDYAVWRKAVFSKDLYTCQCCGARSGNGKTVELNAHHIKNWVDNPDDRYDVNNGITLCERCHNKFHSMYGKHNNTYIQLSEYLSDKKVC